MLKHFLIVFCFFTSIVKLNANQLDFLSLFLPKNPVISQVGDVFDEDQNIDLLEITWQDFQYLKNSPQILKKAKAIHAEIPKKTRKYRSLKRFLEKKGFLSWQKKESLIFIKKDFFYNFETKNFLKHNSIKYPKYRKYYVPFFKTYYYVLF